MGSTLFTPRIRTRCVCFSPGLAGLVGLAVLAIIGQYAGNAVFLTYLMHYSFHTMTLDLKYTKVRNRLLQLNSILACNALTAQLQLQISLQPSNIKIVIPSVIVVV